MHAMQVSAQAVWVVVDTRCAPVLLRQTVYTISHALGPGELCMLCKPGQELCVRAPCAWVCLRVRVGPKA